MYEGFRIEVLWLWERVFSNWDLALCSPIMPGELNLCVDSVCLRSMDSYRVALSTSAFRTLKIAYESGSQSA